MADVVPSDSVWRELPEFRKVQKWVEAVPDAAERIMSELETEAAWARRNAERRLNCAMALMVLTIAATVVLAVLDKTLPAIFSSSGGTIGVATTLITGRSPALRRKPSRGV